MALSTSASPIETRATAATGAVPGQLVPGGVSKFLEAMHGNLGEFVRWRREPVTRRVVAALQDLMVHPPALGNNVDALIQYGVQQGLALAFHMCVDPSAIWPEVFTASDEAESPGVLPEMDFETSIDSVFNEQTKSNQK